jgi:hypothetical protein
MPTTWPEVRFAQFRHLHDAEGCGQGGATVVVGTTRRRFFDIQELRWASPPATAKPDQRRTIDGRKYLLFYSGKKLHMVAWRIGSSTYWVNNTLDDAIPNATLLGIATSFKRVR